MFKHILVLVLLSVLAIMFKAEIAVVLGWITGLHHHVLTGLSGVFSEDKMGLIARNSLALLIIPMVVTAIVACVLWVLRRKMIPFLPEVMWVVWLLLLALITVGQGSA